MKRHLMKAKILRNIFINLAVLIALTRLLTAGTNDGVLNLSETPLGHSNPTLITFDPPGSTATFPMGINPAGVITGYYRDAVTCHGFIRAPDGTITTFDVPGSGYTQPVGIDPAGTTTGGYCDPTFTVCHGFVRSPQGTFTSFDPFFIPNLSGIINPAGAITGYFFTPD